MEQNQDSKMLNIFRKRIAGYPAETRGRAVILSLCLAACSTVTITEASEGEVPPVRTLTPAQSERAAANYEQYCVLCHGADREGYANDHAPSLRSKSLLESGVPHAILRPLSYGRQGTAMGGYLDEVGGPLTMDETWDLTYWLYEQSGVERIAISTDPVAGDVELGARIYQRDCTQCHGVNGQGVNAPALANRSALAHNSDEFYRHAIRKGRENTPMVAYEGTLSAEEIDGLTAFIRSRADGEEQRTTVLRELPKPDEYIINPEGEDPEFELSEGKYVSADDLYQALQEKRRMALLDTRVTSVWQTAHIEGSFPLPYYTDFERMKNDLPTDVMIVAYCSCPRAAAEWVTNKLNELGFEQTAVLYEGIFGWQNLGYPVTRRDLEAQVADLGD